MRSVPMCAGSLDASVRGSHDRAVDLTIYVEDVDAVPASEVASLRDKALQAISGEGIAVVVELSEEDPPRTE